MVLLVVDAQNGIVDERLYEFRKFVGNIKKLRSEEHTSELQSHYSISYAVFSNLNPPVNKPMSLTLSLIHI